MVSVVLDNVRIDFPIYGAQHRSLRSSLFRRVTGGIIKREEKDQRRITVRALNDISLRLEEGDRVGLIGHNGSGKSTLLKVIAGIYEPVRGRLIVEGRITPLFELMPGLDPDDTGYDNILTAAMLFGLSHQEAEEKMPEIEEFCGLGEFLALPVRTYSAGMVMRLGFSLVTALNPDVLVVDEGLGAGDSNFTEKSAERMTTFFGRSRIMVLASHSETLIRSICNKAVLMESGQIVNIGRVDDILAEYHGTRDGAARAESP